MRSYAIRRLPVVGQDRELVGVLTLDDVIALLAEEFMMVGKLLGKQEPSPNTPPSPPDGAARSRWGGSSVRPDREVRHTG